ncbi:SGNH/GDSL hydrolase family protein [Sansalvadorimonas sp. 2012CJ34-2]|uniref:SGNH/GDSL hydrolase family protein n=1 Tax=Parendozoicomonas callyspongiae TaxID=2942213 RepID=A0ABT0PCV4_9GAMM|nr:SGNH/GDSL hydrolase family protein [Sansalvadorimonas sp. 2012CJ34-2]MCL6269222.1 SGNH/GDSL hydrolase family protein [Sansalvadorimonas sp. 2012CJ34-2]
MGRRLKRSGQYVLACLILLLSSTLVISDDELIRLRRVVVFGDSLSDTGNTSQLFEYFRGVRGKPWYFDDLFSSGWSLLPVGMFVGAMPPKAYYQGRFSNGPLASELAVEMLGLDTQDPDQFVNLAFGGSWSVSSWQFLQSWLGLWQDQRVHTQEWLRYLAGGIGKWILPSTYELAHWYLQHHKRLDPDTLYIMASGSNDYQNQFWDVEAIVATQVSIIERLILKGARHIGWGTLPDLTFTPCFQNSPSVPKILETVEAHNRLISKVKLYLETVYPDVKIVFADGYSAMKLFFQHASVFGFSVTDHGCTNITIPGCYSSPGDHSIFDVRESDVKVCEKPDEHFFWDALHPTARAYEHMAAYLCVMAGLEGYWTDCRLPKNFRKHEAEALMNLLLDEGISSSVLPDRKTLEQLLHL